MIFKTCPCPHDAADGGGGVVESVLHWWSISAVFRRASLSNLTNCVIIQQQLLRLTCHIGNWTAQFILPSVRLVRWNSGQGRI